MLARVPKRLIADRSLIIFNGCRTSRSRLIESHLQQWGLYLYATMDLCGQPSVTASPRPPLLRHATESPSQALDDSAKPIRKEPPPLFRV